MWLLKFLVKIVLSYIPLGYSIWRKFGLFRHGSMDAPEYAYKVFMSHLNDTGIATSELKEKTVFEIGPGDTVSTGIIGKMYDVEKTFLVDKGCFVNTDSRIYTNLLEWLETKVANVNRYEIPNNFSSLCKVFSIYYKTESIQSLNRIPSDSCDFGFSQAVLQGIAEEDLSLILREIHRILKSTGKFSSEIDLADYIDHGLGALRVPESIWDSKFLKCSRVYTNRLRFSEYLTLIDKIGFSYIIVDKQYWTNMPVDKSKLIRRFRKFGDEELCIKSFRIVLTKKI